MDVCDCLGVGLLMNYANRDMSFKIWTVSVTILGYTNEFECARLGPHVEWTS